VPNWSAEFLSLKQPKLFSNEHSIDPAFGISFHATD
jgi:hypothetical protein